MANIRIPERKVNIGTPTIQARNITPGLTPSAFGVDAANSFKKLGNIISSTGDLVKKKEREKENQSIIDADTQFKIKLQDSLINNNIETITDVNGNIINRKIGLLNRELGTADGASIEYDKIYKKLEDETLKDKSKYAQGVLGNLLKTSYVSNRDNVISHEGRQTRQYRANSLNSNLDVRINDMSISPSLDNINTNTSVGRGMIIQDMRDSGYDNDTISLKVIEFNNKTANSIVMSLLGNENYSQARLVLESQKEGISPGVYSQLESKIGNGTYLEYAKNISNSGLSIEEQLQEVDKITEPKLFEKVRSEVNKRYEQKKAIAIQAKNEYEQGEWDNLVRNPVNHKIPIERLDSSTQNAMLRFQKIAIKEANGTSGQIDWNQYNKLELMSQKQLKRVALSEIVKIGDKTKITELINKRSDAIKGINGNKAERSITVQRQVNTYISGMAEFRLVKGKANKDQNINKSQFIEQFDKKFKLLEPEQQTVENVSSILNQLSRPLKVPRFGFDKSIKAYKLPYFEDEQKRKDTIYNSLPEDLKDINNLQYSESTDQYYVDTNNFREVYNASGKLVAKLKRI